MLGASFVIRGIGDINENWLSWASPMGWAIGVRAFADERWWTLGLLAAVAAAIVVVAYALADRRDLGSGLLAEKPGAPAAPGWLSSPTAMAWRLQRVSVAAWSFGLFTMGLLFGSVSDAIESMIETNPEIADMIAQVDGASITDGFLASSLSILALLATGFALSSTLRMRSDETAGLTELVLTSPMSRSTLAAGSLVVTLVGTVLVMVAAGAGLALGNLLVVGSEDEFVTLVASSLTQLPAIFVFVGLGLAVFGWLPRQSTLAWVAFAAVLAIGILGDLLGLPSWATDWSPFAILPLVPAEELEWGPMIGLVVVDAVGAGQGIGPDQELAVDFADARFAQHDRQIGQPVRVQCGIAATDEREITFEAAAFYRACRQKPCRETVRRTQPVERIDRRDRLEGRRGWQRFGAEARFENFAGTGVGHGEADFAAEFRALDQKFAFSYQFDRPGRDRRGFCAAARKRTFADLGRARNSHTAGGRGQPGKHEASCQLSSHQGRYPVSRQIKQEPLTVGKRDCDRLGSIPPPPAVCTNARRGQIAHGNVDENPCRWRHVGDAHRFARPELVAAEYPCGG